MAALFASRYETGDATAIDKNRTEVKYLLLKEELSAVDMRMIELSQRLAVLNSGEMPECDYTMPPAEEQMPLEVLLADWEEYAKNHGAPPAGAGGALRRPPQQATGAPRKSNWAINTNTVRESISTASRRD